MCPDFVISFENVIKTKSVAQESLIEERRHNTTVYVYIVSDLSFFFLATAYSNKNQSRIDIVTRNKNKLKCK